MPPAFRGGVETGGGRASQHGAGCLDFDSEIHVVTIVTLRVAVRTHVPVL